MLYSSCKDPLRSRFKLDRPEQTFCVLDRLGTRRPAGSNKHMLIVSALMFFMFSF